MEIFFDPIQDIIQSLKEGEMVIIADDEARENEGDLIMAATHLTAEHMNFMIQHGSGIVCLTLTEEKAKALHLPPMVEKNTSHRGTNFTISIEAAQGVSTGVSASDRTTTIQAAVAKEARPTDLVHPGHVFPVVAKKGGVLARAGHTEASIDLMCLAGLEPCAVLVEIMNKDGTMARRDDLFIFKKQYGLKMGTVADLIEYRLKIKDTV